MLSLEVVKIPKSLIGTVFAINGMSSQGLLILNPGHIDPGFIGPISICAINLSKESFKLSLGQSIFTLVLNELSSELEESELYKPTYLKTTRKEYEKLRDKNSFSKLSNSFFDLIVGYKEAKVLLIKKLYKNFITDIKRIISFIVTAGAILGAIYLVIPKSVLFKNQSNQEESQKVILKKDSIINVKDSIIREKELELKNLKKGK